MKSARSAAALVCLVCACATAPQGSRAPATPAPALQASECAPTSTPIEKHRELWQRARELERQEQWGQMEQALAQAVELAPRFANYSYKQGYALIKLAETETDRAKKEIFYRRAAAPLSRCLEVDPALAECHHFLGEALLATHATRAALEHYAAAIKTDPSVAYFYPPFAHALIALKQYDVAAGVLAEAFRVLPNDARNAEQLYAMHLLSFQVAQARADQPGMVRAMENALAVSGDRHPDVFFGLGAAYAVANPPNRERAREFLDKFVRRVCRGALAQKFADSCETAQDLYVKLGNQPR